MIRQVWIWLEVINQNQDITIINSTITLNYLFHPGIWRLHQKCVMQYFGGSQARKSCQFLSWPSEFTLTQSWAWSSMQNLHIFKPPFFLCPLFCNQIPVPVVWQAALSVLRSQAVWFRLNMPHLVPCSFTDSFINPDKGALPCRYALDWAWSFLSHTYQAER